MNKQVIGIVGPCAAGKSTLAGRLSRAGYAVKHIAQEHSYVKDMWRRITNPALLIYLRVSYPVTLERRRISWTIDEYQVQIDRLQDARKHADIVIDTDHLSIDEVYNMTRNFLQEQGVKPSSNLSPKD